MNVLLLTQTIIVHREFKMKSEIKLTRRITSDRERHMNGKDFHF